MTTRELREWMGHADAKTTARYAHYRSRGGKARRLAAAFQAGDPLQAELQPNGLHEPAVPFRVSAPVDAGIAGETGFPWNGADAA